MAIHEKEEHIPSAPTDASIFYPEEDGEPMAFSDLHRRILMRILQVFDEHFKPDLDAYVSGDILMYYVEGNPRKSVSAEAAEARAETSEAEAARLREELERLQQTRSN